MFDHTSPPGDDSASAIPVEAYQLADHLDAALAAAEDLEAAGRNWQSARAGASGNIAAEMAAERAVIERVKAFEAMLIGRIVKARKRAQSLAQKTVDFSGMTRLFVGGTAVLVDAVAELGDTTLADFNTADSMLAYLRRRGVVAADASDLPASRMISIDQSFLVAGRIPLGALSDMVAAFLDALELHYDLYPGAETDAGEAVSITDILQAMRAGPANQSAAAEAGGDDARESPEPKASGDEPAAPHSAPSADSKPAEATAPVKPLSLIERLDAVSPAPAADEPAAS